MSDKKEKYVTINAVLKNYRTMEDIQARVVCKYQYAIAMFSDPKLAKKLAKAEARGGKDVRYDPKLNVVVERFKGKSAIEIAEIIGKQMKKQGGKLVNG